MFGFIITKKRISNIMLVTVLVLTLLSLVIFKSTDGVEAEVLQPATAEIERIAFIENLGYKVNRNQPEQKKQIEIPYILNDVYKEYVKIQNSAGYYPEKYAGKRVDLYTYEIFFENRTDVYAHLLVADEKIIGGDISALSVENGFIYPLTPIEQ